MNKIILNRDVIYCEKINRDITLIHISDIHFNKYTKDKKLDSIKEEIRKIANSKTITWYAKKR